MKGVIVNCLACLVTEKFGEDKWRQSLEKVGVDPDKRFLATENVDDEVALKVVGSVCEVLGMTLTQAADAFGDYWVNDFAPKIYAPIYRGKKSAKEFLLAMDEVHKDITRSIADARPPQFEYQWENDNSLIMKYKSHRGLIDIMIGLVKGVGRYFKEQLTVTKINDSEARIVFPS